MPPHPTAHRPRPGRVLLALAGTLVSALLLSGCGGGSEDEPAEQTPAEVMEQAKKLFDDASSVRIELATDSTPPAGSNGVLGASGDLTQAPAFEGDVKVVFSGITATIPVTSVDGTVFAKLPLQTKYTRINPSEYGAPDPADFADPDKGLSSLLTQMEDLEKGEQTRSGEQILTSYTGTLSGAAVKEIIPSADAEGTYQAEVGIDDDGFARTVEVTGVFFSDGKDVTYDVEFSGYDQGAEITAPKI
jgi:lipoprotein LprG